MEEKQAFLEKMMAELHATQPTPVPGVQDKREQAQAGAAANKTREGDAAGTSPEERTEGGGEAPNVDEATASQWTDHPNSSSHRPPDEQAGHENPPSEEGGEAHTPGEGDGSSDPG